MSSNASSLSSSMDIEGEDAFLMSGKDSSNNNNAEAGPRQAFIKRRVDGGAEEWIMIELQGSLETRPYEGKSFQSVDLGSLQLIKADTYQLQIGRQVVEGKLVPLKQPFAVLKRAPNKAATSMLIDSADDDDDDNASKQKQQHDVEYNVLALIKNKILFRNRPTTKAE